MNLDAIDLKRSLVGTVGIVVAVLFIGILGPAGLLAGLCAIFLGALDEPDPMRERLVLQTRFVVIGALVIGLMSWSGTTVWWATVVAAWSPTSARWPPGGGPGWQPKASSSSCSRS